MIRTKKLLLTAIFSVVMALALIFGITLSLPVQQASAADGTFGSGWAYTNAQLNGGGYATQTLETVDAATAGYDGSGTVLKMSSTTTNGGTGVTVSFSESGYTKATVESINFKVRFDYTSTPTDSEFRLHNGSGWLFTYLVYIENYASGTWNTITIDANHTAWANMFDSNGALKDVNVCTRIKTSQITWYFADVEIVEKEETVVDITETVSIGTKATYGDYQEAYMIRVQIPTDTSWGSGKCLNDSYPNMLKYLTINGKTIYDLRAEYAAALAAGTAKQITWTGYPDNTSEPRVMQPNIADDVTRAEPRALYAPIFAMLTYHGSLSANCIDIYIPGTYLDPAEIETFGITEDFSWIAEDGTVYKTSDSVTFYGLGYKQAYKQIGELNLTETETTVTAVQPNASNTNFLLIYLSENNYDGLSHEKGNLQANSVAMENMAKLKLWNYIEVDGKPMTSVYRDNNVSEIYYQVWSKADSFAFRVTTLPTDGTGAASKITIKAGAQFPKYSGDTATLVSATECYTVKKEMVFVNENGTWVEYTEKIETNVTMAQMLYDTPTDAFAGIMLEGSDYASAPNTYAGGVVTVLSYAQSANFLSHILIDDVALPQPGEAFLNVWRNYGYFNFRTGNNTATKITILAGCEFPTYKALMTGASQTYVTEHDVTFIKNSDGVWVKDEGSFDVVFKVDGATYHTQKVANGGCATAPETPTKASSATHDYVFSGWYLDGAKYEFSTPVSKSITLEAKFTAQLKAGEYETNVKELVYARDNANNWMMFTLSNKDYPNAGETYNIATTEAQISALNLYDKIVVDNMTLRNRIAKHGNPAEAPKINLWVADCLAIRIAGCAGALDGAQKVTIKAGAQFPSYAYITGGVEAYYVTTEEVTFVNVGADNGAWERQYTATFVADGEVVETISYLVSEGFTAPEVPEKEGYKGVWESYTANGNITVNAVYTKKATVLGTTGLKEIRRIDNNSNILIINPSNSDYPASVAGSYNIGLDVSHLQKFNLLDYITINGTTLRELGVTEMSINKFTRAGLGLTTVLSDSMTIVIKKGCEIPSYAFWQSPDGEASCYVMDADYTCVYTHGAKETEGIAFTITASNIEMNTPEFDKDYVLSDLYNVGYTKTSVFADGVEVIKRAEGEDTEANYRYGHLDGTSFSLSFDFKFTGAGYGYGEHLYVNLGTEGHGGTKYHFGWRFYLIRGAEGAVMQNYCVEYFSNTKGKMYYDADNQEKGANIVAYSFGNAAFVEGETYHVTIGYKLVNAATGEVYVYTAINQYAAEFTDVLGGDFINFAPYATSLTMNTMGTATVTVCDPGKMGATEANRYQVYLKNENGAIIGEEQTSKITLPTLSPIAYNKGGNVFVGWTTDLTTLPNLYPAGYELTVTKDTTLYPVWLGFTMRKGAGVRTVADSSGIRFIVDVDGGGYDLGVSKGLITEIGTILVPTDTLYNKPLTHTLGAGNYAVSVTDKWQQAEGAVRTYSSAFVKIHPDQYCRYFSARGYMKIQYTSGEGYIYTEYDESNHSRSIYQVATAAFNDTTENYNKNAVVQGYVNDVADITVGSTFNAGKTDGAVGAYTVNATTSGNTITITVDKVVKAAFINGTRVIMGNNTEIVVDNKTYTLSDYKLNSNGLQLSFTLGNEEEISKEYYLARLQTYIDSDAYTDLHKKAVLEWAQGAYDAIQDSDDPAIWKEAFEMNMVEVEAIKTAEELAANNTGTETLDAPVLSRGLGYTVTWSEVNNVDYYCVYDSNDYREYTVVMAGEPCVYEAEVVGNHNITVTAHSFYEDFNSATSNEMTTPEVKPVFTYKSMLDGMYKFTDTQMGTMGISDEIKNKCASYEEKDDGVGGWLGATTKWYIVYYNKDMGWSPYPIYATDWTSPAEFPAHAQKLKDMGNNIILIAYDTNASYKADDTWLASRMRYVMDTAWSMGMKVLVCDQVFYDLSMSDGSDGAATSKAQVTEAIKARNGFADYVQHPAFYGFSLDDEPYGKYISAMSYTISALDDACEALGVSDPFYLACLFQYQGGDEIESYLSQDSLESYYNKWLAIEGVDSQYLYVDIYTQHAMDQPTNRYNGSFEVVYSDSYLGGKHKFHQAITAHTQNDGVLLEQDLYMSLLYAAAHNVAGYSWFCYFPITGELSGTMVGYNGNGYGNGIGNGASGCYYNAAKTAGYQFELIQGLLDGYKLQTRTHSDSKNLLTTTLSNGTSTATMYVNADVDGMSGSVTVTASGSQCYLVGYGVGTAEAPYQAVSGSVTLTPGQAVICIA